jgi:hypothetical protein
MRVRRLAANEQSEIDWINTCAADGASRIVIKTYLIIPREPRC